MFYFLFNLSTKRFSIDHEYMFIKKLGPVILVKLISSQMTYSFFLITDAGHRFSIPKEAFIVVLTDSRIDQIVSCS